MKNDNERKIMKKMKNNEIMKIIMWNMKIVIIIMVKNK